MPPKETALQNIATLQQPVPKKRRTAQEQALTPLVKRRDALKKRWDDADAAALTRNKEKYGPECDELDAMIKAIEGMVADDE